MADPQEAFNARNSLELRLTDEAWDYMRGVAKLANQYDRNPSWVTVISALADMGVEATDRPVRRLIKELRRE